MAERVKFSGTDIGIGIAVLLVVFVAVFLAAGALGLSVPQWLLSAVAALVGVAIWFAVIKRRRT